MFRDIIDSPYTYFALNFFLSSFLSFFSLFFFGGGGSDDVMISSHVSRQNYEMFYHLNQIILTFVNDFDTRPNNRKTCQGCLENVMVLTVKYQQNFTVTFHIDDSQHLNSVIYLLTGSKALAPPDSTVADSGGAQQAPPPPLTFDRLCFYLFYNPVWYQNASGGPVVAERSKRQCIHKDRELPFWRFPHEFESHRGSSALWQGALSSLPSLSMETLSRRDGIVYWRVTPYARKRTYFTSRKEQGEIPVKWSDSQTYGNG